MKDVGLSAACILKRFVAHAAQRVFEVGEIAQFLVRAGLRFAPEMGAPRRIFGCMSHSVVLSLPSIARRSAAG